MNNINIDVFKHKSCLVEFAYAVAYYLGNMLLFNIVQGINSYDFHDQNTYNSGLQIITGIYIRNLIVLVLVGILYGILSNLGNFKQRKRKFSLDARKLIIWVIPGLILVLWHIIWAAFQIEFYPFYIIGERNIFMPSFLAIMLFIIGYIVSSSFFKRETKCRGILWPIAFTSIMAASIVVFQYHIGFPVAYYTPAGFFLVFALYGGIGILFGAMYNISDESKKVGQWNLDLSKLIAWSAFSFAVLIYTVVVHLDTPTGLIRNSSIQLMFIFGNSIVTSFYKAGK